MRKWTCIGSARVRRSRRQGSKYTRGRKRRKISSTLFFSSAPLSPVCQWITSSSFLFLLQCFLLAPFLLFKDRAVLKTQKESSRQMIRHVCLSPGPSRLLFSLSLHFPLSEREGREEKLAARHSALPLLLSFFPFFLQEDKR